MGQLGAPQVAAEQHGQDGLVSRTPLRLAAAGASSSALAWAWVSQLPIRVPADFMPLTLPMPMAS
jgi:predicted acyltransferase